MPAQPSKDRAAWLEEVSAALSLAVRETGNHTEAGRERRWVSVALARALQASLVLALTGYETAERDDILSPSGANESSIAPIALLIRRAVSPRYLNPPERPQLSRQERTHIETLIAHRNAVLHETLRQAPMLPPEAYGATLNLITHLILEYPAFPPSPHGIVLALIKDKIGALMQVLMSAG